MDFKRFVPLLFVTLFAALVAGVFPHGADNIAGGTAVWTWMNSPTEPSASESLPERRQQYEKKAESELNQFDRQVSRLKTDGARESAKTRLRVNQEIQELNEKSQVARLKLRGLEGSSQETWNNMKMGLDAAMKDLETSYRLTASQVK